MADRIRVVIADDHALMRRAVASLLERETGFEVVGECARSEETFQVVQAARPDILLLDLDASCASEEYLGILRRCRAEFPWLRVVVMTDHTENQCTIMNPARQAGLPWMPESCCLHKSLRAGARGAVRKSGTPEEMAKVLRLVYAGDYAFEAPVASQALNSLMGRRESHRPTLTQREKEVVRLLVEGRSNKEIGHSLGIREQTVKNYVSRLLEKTELEGRVQLAIYALQNHLLEEHPV